MTNRFQILIDRKLSGSISLEDNQLLKELINAASIRDVRNGFLYLIDELTIKARSAK